MKQHDPERRYFLNAAIGLGGALAVPAILAACGDRESATSQEAQKSASPTTSKPPPAIAPEKAPAATGTDSAPGGTESNKLSKEQAQYQEQPKGDQRCDNCIHYVAESNTCKLVQGDIAPDAWCMLWAAAPKAG